MVGGWNGQSIDLEFPQCLWAEGSYLFCEYVCIIFPSYNEYFLVVIVESMHSLQLIFHNGSKMEVYCDISILYIIRLYSSICVFGNKNNIKSTDSQTHSV